MEVGYGKTLGKYYQDWHRHTLSYTNAEKHAGWFWFLSPLITLIYHCNRVKYTVKQLVATELHLPTQWMPKTKCSVSCDNTLSDSLTFNIKYFCPQVRNNYFILLSSLLPVVRLGKMLLVSVLTNHRRWGLQQDFVTGRKEERSQRMVSVEKVELWCCFSVMIRK